MEQKPKEGCCVAHRGALRRHADDRGCAARIMAERLASRPATLPVDVREIRSRVCRCGLCSSVCMSFGCGQHSPPRTPFKPSSMFVRSHMVGYDAHVGYLPRVQLARALCFVQFHGRGDKWWPFLFRTAFIATCTVFHRSWGSLELNGRVHIARATSRGHFART